MSRCHLLRIACAIFAGVSIWTPYVRAQSIEDTEHRLPPPPELREDASAPPPATTERPMEGDNAALPPFTLTAIHFRGATAFQAKDFAPLYDAYLAQRVGIAELTHIADAVTRKYREAGYFLSRAIIPAQRVESGLVTIEIIEGYIGTVVVEGDHSKAAELIARSTLESRPARLGELERAVLLINDLNGVTVRQTALRPDIDDLARHTLALTLDTQKLAARVYADNRGTAEIGRLQAYLQGAVHSLLRSADMLAGGLFFTPDKPDELLFAQGSYTTPIGNTGLYATIYGARSAVHPDRNPPDGSSGHSLHSLIRFSYPFVRKRRLSVWGNVGFETRDVRENQPTFVVYKDKLRDITASIYMVAKHEGGVSTLFVEVVNGVIAERPVSAPFSRADADGQFTKARFEATRTQPIAGPFDLYVAATGQVASDAVLSSEEFAFGGSRYGRAFDYAEIAGDDGIAGVVELRFSRRANLPLISSYQVYAFYDVGTVWNRNSSDVSLSSAGAGLRLFLQEDISLSYEAARPIDGITGDIAGEGWRHFFSASKAF